MHRRIVFYEITYGKNSAKIGLNCDGVVVDVDGLASFWVGEQFGRLINWLRRSYGHVSFRELPQYDKDKSEQTSKPSEGGT